MHRTVPDIISMKKEGKRISAVTSYDYTMASLCDRAGIDILLVGDSAGMVMLGYESTVPVTMDQMCMFTEAVGRARKDALLVADMPFMSYQPDMGQAIANAGRLVRAGADAVKLEGGAVMTETVGAIVDVGIPVMGHIGLQPQTSMLSGGYRVQGRTAESAMRLVKDAKELEAAGVFAIVIEMTCREAAQVISDVVGVPVIGIGAGGGCDGQVLVAQDLLGMYDKISPKFVKRYGDLAGEIVGALERYRGEVSSGAFPSDENSFPMDAGELEELQREIGS